MSDVNPASNETSEPFLRERSETRLVNYISLGLGALIGLITISWAIDFWLELGFTWYDEQAMIACLGLTLALVFVRVPAIDKGKQRALPWYDAILAATGAFGALFLIYIYEDIANNPFQMRPMTFVVGLVMIPLVWEALRRTAGLSLTLIFTAFIAYGFVGHLMPGMLKGVVQKPYEMIGFLATSEVSMLGLPLKIIVLTVVLFIWMGQLLLFTGASQWFTDIASALMGRSRGGSAKIAVVASGLFGSISGSAVSNVASTGVITIPLMRQAGYNGRSAAAIEAVASTGGQIMPPIMGAAAFLMAELLELSYTEIILAALIPAGLYYLAVFVQADLEAAKNNIAPLPPERIPPLGRVMMEGWFFLTPFVVLVFTLFWMNMAPQKAAFWAAVSVAFVSNLFGYRGNRIGPWWSVPVSVVVFALAVAWYTPMSLSAYIPAIADGSLLTKVWGSLEKASFAGALALVVVSIIVGSGNGRPMWASVTGAGRSSADIIVIGAMAGVIIGILDKSGLGQSLTLILSAVGQDNLFVLLVLTAIISIVLGMGMPTSAIYLLLATMIAPSLIKLGINPIAAHMFVLYFGLMSMITPPVAIAAFAAASLAGSKPMETGLTAVRLGWIAYIVPFVFVLSPALIMQGHWLEITTATVTAAIGVWIASCGFIGYMFRPMQLAERGLFVAAGIALLIPAHGIPYGVHLNIAGGLIGFIAAVRQSARTRSGPGEATPA